MMAKSDLVVAILRKHMSQPWAASSSGWMWVSVKKTKSKEPGCGGLSARGSPARRVGKAAVAPAAARVFRKFLRSSCIIGSICEVEILACRGSCDGGGAETWAEMPTMNKASSWLPNRVRRWRQSSDGRPGCGCVPAERLGLSAGPEFGGAWEIVSTDATPMGASVRPVYGSRQAE